MKSDSLGTLNIIPCHIDYLYHNYYVQEIHALRAHLEAAKYDVIKYCIGTLVSISAVGLAVLRILM